jgi:hypothetical protein
MAIEGEYGGQGLFYVKGALDKFKSKTQRKRNHLFG